MTKLVTRERPKIDRIACPWLIRRFVHRDAEFLYVPIERVFAVAKETGAMAYDIPGADPFSNVGELCSCDAFIKHYNLHDPGPAPARRDRASRRHGAARPRARRIWPARNVDGAVGEHPGRPRPARAGRGDDALYTWCRGAAGEIHN